MNNPPDDPDHYEVTRRFFDLAAQDRQGYYDARPGGPARHSVWQRGVRRLALFLLDRQLRGGDGPVLDVGCGRGDFTRTLARRFRGASAVWGCDFSAAALALARAAAGPGDRHLSFVRAQLLDLPFADGAFHGSVCLNVLHHLPAADLPGALDELSRISRRFLMVEIKNRDNPYYRVVNRRSPGPGCSFEVYPTSRRRVDRLLGRRGFALHRRLGIFGFQRLSPLLVLLYRRV